MAISRNILPIVIISLAFVLVTGCDSRPKDVTNDPAFGNFKSVAGTWKTKVPLRLVEIKKELYLATSLEPYSEEDRQLLAVPVGTEIRIEHLIFRQTFETDFLDVMGGIVTSPYSGKSVKIDSHLFVPVDCPPGGGKGTPTQYYSVWHGTNYPKPDWVAAPEKLERPDSGLVPQK